MGGRLRVRRGEASWRSARGKLEVRLFCLESPEAMPQEVITQCSRLISEETFDALCLKGDWPCSKSHHQTMVARPTTSARRFSSRSLAARVAPKNHCRLENSSLINFC